MRNNQLIVLDGKSSKSSERPPKIAVLQHGCADMSFCNHSKQEALLTWNAAAVGQIDPIHWMTVRNFRGIP